MKDVITNLGDINWMDHGGFLVYRENEQLYADLIEVIAYTNNDITEWQVSTICLDVVNLSNPEWFIKNLQNVADFIGIDHHELLIKITSNDEDGLSFVYQALVDYFGAINFDQSPVCYTDREELESQYKF